MRVKGLERSHREAPDPKSGVSANFTTLALQLKIREILLIALFHTYRAI